jgi:hypothetical protein
MPMDMVELEQQIAVLLRSFFISSRKINLIKGVSVQFIIDDFGVIVCGINRVDYVQIDDAVNNQFPGWRVVYITTNDRMLDKKYDVLWALMRGGYMRWLRFNYPRQVKNVLMGPDNLGQRIIDERLRIWGDQPKYRFLVEDNKIVRINGLLREFTRDQGFFDYMPEDD